MEAIFWSVVQRTMQASLQAAPFIFTGLCVTGIMHRLLGHAHTRRLFGSNSIASLFQAWIIGMLLPGCSLGVIPIVKQLRRCGVAVGTIFAFALSSPLFDPLSLLYGLTLSKPATILIFALCSLVVVTVCGAIFDWLYPNTAASFDEPPPTPRGARRVLAVLVVMAREMTSGTVPLICVGLLGVGLLSVVLPPNSLQRSMASDDPWSPLLMAGVAIPAYATPMTAMSQLGSMFQHGNSIGAAFILLTFGAGMNLGLVAWMVLHYGWRKALVWFALMLVFVVAFSYGIERPLHPKDIEPADHTHAFDIYCRPFDIGDAPPLGYPREIWSGLKRDIQPHELVGAALLAFLAILGAALKWLDRRWVIEDWLNRPATASAARGWDVDLPAPALAAFGLAAIVGFSFLGCYAYYPPHQETLEELRLANVEAVSGAMTDHAAHALHWIPVCEDWNRRLQVGVYLRSWRLSEFHRMKARVFRDQLETLEHMVENQDPREDIREQALAVSRSYHRLANAYLHELN